MHHSELFRDGVAIGVRGDIERLSDYDKRTLMIYGQYRFKVKSNVYDLMLYLCFVSDDAVYFLTTHTYSSWFKGNRRVLYDAILTVGRCDRIAILKACGKGFDYTLLFRLIHPDDEHTYRYSELLEYCMKKVSR